MKRTSALALLTVATLGLSACGSNETNDSTAADSSANASAQQESTNQATSGKEDTEKSTGPSKKSAPNPTQPGSNGSSGDRSNQADGPSSSDDSRSRKSSGTTPSKVGGSCGTTAENATLTALKNTSCEFAREIYRTALDAQFELSAPAPDVTRTPHANISATSPVNNESYDLKCSIGSGHTNMVCADQSDRTVGVGVSFPNPGSLQRAMPQVLALYKG